jgi:hypothetical protein
MKDVVRVAHRIEEQGLKLAIALTGRQRMARRRKAVAFHWSDENWDAISHGIFDEAIGEVLESCLGL